LNVGLVGYRAMGRAHSNAFARLDMFFDPHAKVNRKVICGRDESRLKQAAVKLGWEETETSWEKLVLRDDIDIVDIATPSDSHHNIAIKAAENGKHVFCEKPLAVNLMQARKMLEAAEKNNVRHQTGFNYRFCPAIATAKKMIESGKLGTVRHIRARYLQDYLTNPDVGMMWRLRKEICGSGSLGDLGSHAIDLARYLCGDIKTVVGMQKTFIKKRPDGNGGFGEVNVDDASVFVAEFESGALGTFESSRYASGHKNDLGIEVCGDLGSVKFDFERMNELMYYSAEDEYGNRGFKLLHATEGCHPYMNAWWGTAHVIGYEHTFVHEMYEFVNSVADDKPTSPSFYDGMKCSQIMEAVELSTQRRTMVDVDSI